MTVTLPSLLQSGKLSEAYTYICQSKSDGLPLEPHNINPTSASRLLPLLDQVTASTGRDFFSSICSSLQLCRPRVELDRCFLIREGWYLLSGWTDSLSPLEAVVLTSCSQWHHQIVSAPRLARPDVATALNLQSICDCGFLFAIQLPDHQFISRCWLNGVELKLDPVRLTDTPYLSLVDDLLLACNIHHTSSALLPALLNTTLADILLHARSPLFENHSYQNLIRSRHSFGPVLLNSELTIVVPLYGRWDFVKGQVAGFLGDSTFTSRRVRVFYVVDDPEIVPEFLTWCSCHLADDLLSVEVLVLSRNMGFAMACNIGVYSAQTAQVLLLNSDVLPINSSWLDPLQDHLRSFPSSLVAPLLLYDNGLIQHAGMESRRDGPLNLPINSHPFKGLHPSHLSSLYPDLRPFAVKALSGAALLFSREEFISKGGFDPVFGRGDFEDLELSLRWKRNSNHNDLLWLVPQSVLLHLERQSISREPDLLAEWRGITNAWMALSLCPELE